MLKINPAIMNLFYPVGTYYETSDDSFDPNVSWGGTWQLDSQGRVTVSQDTTDTDFDTLGETGGEKTHTLIVSEMPSHTHTAKNNILGGVGTASASLNTSGGSWSYSSQILNNTGGNGAHNNLQPYVVVKRWHRTA